MTSYPYVAPHFVFDDFELQHALRRGNVLGVIEFNRGRPVLSIPAAIPHVRIHMDPYDSEAVGEVWVSSRDVQYGSAGDYFYGCDGETLFACNSWAEGRGNLTDMARDRYHRLFEMTRSLGYSRLFRVWNFFPQINADDEDGLERYKAFCTGRALAFGANGAEEDESCVFPAATGIGSMGGDISIVFLSSRSGVCRHIENPRQIPAYRYPRRYGPRPPSFARASCVEGGEGRAIYVSGTAAVLGHMSTHRGDIEQQIRVTCDNLSTLLGNANMARHGIDGGATPLDLNSVEVYLRRPDEDLPLVKRICDETFAPTKRIAYLRADVCRSELLVEIEGVIIQDRSLSSETRPAPGGQPRMEAESCLGGQAVLKGS